MSKASANNTASSLEDTLMNKKETPSFWKVALSWQGSATPRVVSTVLIFCIYAFFIDVAHYYLDWNELDVTPFEVFGAVLGVLLVFRTNAGYDRWWEGRKIWGGIVNQSRNLVLVGLEYGPKDEIWQRELVKWTGAFSYTCKTALRESRDISELDGELSSLDMTNLSNAPHMPLYTSSRIARLTEIAKTKHGMDGFAYLEMEKHRAALIDYIGACERILKTPMPLVYAIKVRRLILIFLLSLPIAIAPIAYWLAPTLALFVSYPLLSLDVIGMELQNPFRATNLSHLPLTDICVTIRNNLKGMLVEKITIKEPAYAEIETEEDKDSLTKKIMKDSISAQKLKEKSQAPNRSRTA